MKHSFFCITFYEVSDTTIIVYYGDVIDGISVDGEMFGTTATSSQTINLQADEGIVAIEFGHHTHR